MKCSEELNVRQIKSVCWASPSPYENDIYYGIGVAGTTKILEALKWVENYQVIYYEIYKDDKLIADMHHFSRVEYL